MQNNGNYVPNIVRDTIIWLEANGAINEEGLFRVPGQMTIIENLKKEYDTRGTGTLDGITDVASVAGLLKLYLRELPEPLLVFRFYSTFVKIAKNPEAESRLRNLRILVNGLPEANKATVFYLLQFLSKVVANEKVNRMSAANLAMIFSPNLLRTEKEELSQIMMEAGYLTSVVKLMIEEIDYMTNKTDQPATVKMSGGSQIVMPKADLDLSSQSSGNGVDIPLAEMQRRMSLHGSSSEIRTFLETQAAEQQQQTEGASEDGKGDKEEEKAKKLAGDESGSPPEISASELKKKELEDIKQKVKEKEDLLKHLREQLDEDSDEDEVDAGGEGSEGEGKSDGEGGEGGASKAKTSTDEEADSKAKNDNEAHSSKITSSTLLLDEFGGR